MKYENYIIAAFGVVSGSLISTAFGSTTDQVVWVTGGLTAIFCVAMLDLIDQYR